MTVTPQVDERIRANDAADIDGRQRSTRLLNEQMDKLRKATLLAVDCGATLAEILEATEDAGRAAAQVGSPVAERAARLRARIHGTDTF